MTAAVLRGQPVGALACQKDAYLRTLDVEVLSCQKAAQEKERGKNKAGSSGKELWQIEFTDSVLFPEGGGQHSDHGTLLPLGNDGDDSESIPITNVQRDGLRSICYSPRDLESGTKVRQTIDHERRREHMQNHTGQHLLSAIMDTYDNLETLGWGMGTAGSSNYVDLPRTPTKDEIQEIQDRCNEAIRENHTIDVVYPEGDGVADSSEDKNEKGVIRIIKIGDIDSNPCCGTHLRQTSHIRLLLLQSTQPIRSGKATRLYFLTGDHALRHASACTNGIARIAYDLSCGTGADDVVGAVARVKAQAAEARRREGKLLKEVAAFEAQRIRAEVAAGRNGWMHRGAEGMEFVNMVVAEIKASVREAGEAAVVVLAVGEERKAGGVVVVGGSEGAVREAVGRVEGCGVQVRGNGKGERWQGKVGEWARGDLGRLEGVVKAGRSVRC